MNTPKRQTRRKTASLRRLPVNASITTGSKLRTNWDFMVLSGHGTLIEGASAFVPERTFVIFNAPAGLRSTYRFALPYHNILINDDNDAFYDAMLNEIRKPSAFLKTFNAANANMYPPDATTCEGLTDCQKSRAIYPPGAELADLRITFRSNKVTNPVILGLYNLPLQSGIKRHLRGSLKGHSESNANIARFNSAVFNADNGNLIPELIGETITLRRMFTMLPPVPRGKHRLLFITSCRGMEYPPERAVSRPMYSMLSRRASLSARENASPTAVATGMSARKQMEEIPILRKFGLLRPNTLNIDTEKELPNTINVKRALAGGLTLPEIVVLQRALAAKKNGAVTANSFRPAGLHGPLVSNTHPTFERYGPWGPTGDASS